MVESMNNDEYRELLIEASRRDFWTFCQTMHHYKKEWFHIKMLCTVLQAFWQGALSRKEGKQFKRLIINEPPRHFKSRTMVLFSAWLFGHRPKEKLFVASYSESLATDFSRYVRDEISQIRTSYDDIVYEDVFPNTKLKYGNKSFKQWALEGSFFSYKGCGVGTGVTGRGCTVAIIDDIIKSYEEVVNEAALEKKWEWYKNTWRSRYEKGALEIIIMTRWSRNDLCGKLLDGKEPYRIDTLKKCGKILYYDDTVVLQQEVFDGENMLCEDMLDHNSYIDIMNTVDPPIFKANYHNELVDIKGRLYEYFNEYDELPKPTHRKCGFIDIADKGGDYVCGIFGEIVNKKGYIKDIVYNKQGIEYSIELCARAIINNDIIETVIENNYGGSSFPLLLKNVIGKLCKEKGIVNKYVIQEISQRGNKLARIITNAPIVSARLYFNKNWKYKHREFYNHVTTFQREGKNKHDDAEDAMTGFVESFILVSNAPSVTSGRIEGL